MTSSNSPANGVVPVIPGLVVELKYCGRYKADWLRDCCSRSAELAKEWRPVHFGVLCTPRMIRAEHVPAIW